MTFDGSLRLTEILLGFALFQQGLEHGLPKPGQRFLFAPRAVFGVALILGFLPGWTALAAFGHGVLMLRRFDGAYNGGCDRMSLLILLCLCLAHLVPERRWQEIAFGYLAVQLGLSYVVSGWVKIINPDWRSGQALRDVFAFSAYPVSEEQRDWADRPRLLFAVSWCVMLFELFFPVALLTPTTLIFGLTIAASFHLANAFLFGLNRFFWAWIAAYPSIIWLQTRLSASTSAMSW